MTSIAPIGGKKPSKPGMSEREETVSKSLITCDCMGSQTIDTQSLSQTTGLTVPRPCSALCTTQIDRAAKAITQGDAIFSCTQEARVFELVAEELGHPAPAMVDLRNKAGWTADQAPTLPKMSALVAEALLPASPGKSVDVNSEGVCLILGPAEVALSAAEALKDHLGVTVLLTHADDLPDSRAYDVIVGQLRRASGALGQFDVTIDALQQVQPVGAAL